MTKTEFTALLNLIQEEERKVYLAGQSEYAYQDSNAFKNFDLAAEDLNLSREKVLWVYLKKHLDGILAYMHGNTSQREDVRGRIKDARMYLALLWGMVEEDPMPYGRCIYPVGHKLPHVHMPEGTLGTTTTSSKPVSEERRTTVLSPSATEPVDDPLAKWIFVCPSCGSTNVEYGEDTFSPYKVCRSCKMVFDAEKGSKTEKPPEENKDDSL